MKRVFQIVFICVLSIGIHSHVYSQSKQLQIQNKNNTWQHRNINEGSIIKVYTKDLKEIKGMLVIVNDSTLRIGSDTLLLQDISCVKKNKIWKIVLISYCVTAGSLYVGIGTVVLFLDPSAWGAVIAFVAYIQGLPVLTTGLLMHTIKSSYPNYIWNYSIINKKVW